jgi:hypothetical protein
LAIRGAGFNAFVPCLASDLVQPIAPDAAQWPLDDAAFRTALAAVAPIAVEAAGRVIECSVLVRQGTAVATNGKIIAEAWHGQNFPTLVVPKASVAQLLKIKKRIVAFGLGFDPFEPSKILSVTFHFEGNSWLKTQLYLEPWPDVDRLFNEVQPVYAPVPPDFFAAVDRVVPFVAKDFPKLFIGPTELSTSLDESEGATVTFGGFPNIQPDEVHIVSPDYVETLSGHIKYMGFTDEKVFAYGDTYRAIIMVIRG